MPDAQLRSLAYEPNAPPPEVLTLEVFDTWARVTFPAQARAAYVFGILFLAVFTIAQVAMMLWGLFAFRHLASALNATGPLQFPTSFVYRLAVKAFAPVGLGAFVNFGFLTHWIWQYRKWGRVPRILSASADGLSRSRLGFWRMSHRHWARQTIESVELKRIKPLFGKKAHARLLIRRRKKWPLVFRLSSRDLLLPRQIAEAIAEKIGCPLVVRGRA